MPQKRIKISLDQRWSLIGATGSGKTFFMKRLLWAYGRGVDFRLPIFILDTKGYMASLRGNDDFREFYNSGVGRLYRGQDFPDIKKVFRDAVKNQACYHVWQPEFDDAANYDLFYEMLYRSGVPHVVANDEISSIMDGKNVPRYYSILQKQGRMLDSCMIGCFQSAAYIPSDFLRQTTHVIKFRLNDDYDRKKLSSSLGKTMAESEPEHEHGFFYRDVTRPISKNPSLYYSDLKEFFED